MRQLDKKLATTLLKWYRENRRILPWREDPSPYHVWISEIMLQQTRVEAVKGYYARFMEELPGVENLAKVPEERLLKLWEGLGYYNRARNLQKAAKVVMEEYEGQLPSDYETLLSLPGIGSYTAGAIASIAFKEPVPAVDGNVLRVITRVTADASDITSEAFKNKMREQLLEIIPQDAPGEFNQALMDLGAMVCLPNGAPRCDECPWKAVCRAKAENITDQIPVKKAKKVRKVEEKTVLVVRFSDKILLHKRKNKGLLAGMYEFPSIEGFQNSENVIYYLRKIGLKPLHMEETVESKHIFSHKEWHMKGYVVRVDELFEGKNITQEDENWCFVEPWQTKEGYPIPSAFAAYVPYLKNEV